MTGPGPQDSDNRSVFLVGSGTFLYWVSLYLYVPVLPIHAENMGATLSMVGLIVSAYAIAQVVLRIPVGVAADIVGRRKPFAAGALGCTTLGALGLGLAQDPWTLFAARALTGVGAAGWVAISVLFSSYFPAARTAHAMARVMAVNSIGVVAATFVGGIISDYLGARACFFAGVVAGGLGILTMLAAAEPKLTRQGSYSFKTFVRVARTPLLLVVAGIGILNQFVRFGGSFGFVPIYAVRIGATDSQVGYVTGAMFAAGVVGTLAVPRIVAVFGIRVPLLVSFLVSAATVVLVPQATVVWQLVGLQAIGGFLGSGVVNTLLISLSLRDVALEDRATGMGIYQGVYAIGMLSGPLVSGVLADAVSLDAVFYMLAGVSLTGAAACLLRTIPGQKP